MSKCACGKEMTTTPVCVHCGTIPIAAGSFKALTDEIDELRAALMVARDLIIRHHRVGVVPAPGQFCPACHTDGVGEPEVDQIYTATYKQR